MVLVNRKEFDNKIKDILIEKFGYKDFKISWDELSELLGLNLQKTKYHIFKLEQHGFLRVIERAQRSGGYTSPNIIRILKDIGADTNIEPKSITGDIEKYISMLQQKANNIEEYEHEIRRLTLINQQLEQKVKELTRELLDMRDKILDATRFGK
jgi:biotin operon repressor